MRLSIITCTFNSAESVLDTFESVLMQTYKDYEYWVIDGGSNDRTLDIIKEYESKFAGRMKWSSEKDKGIYDAMNKGFQKATGGSADIIDETVGVLIERGDKERLHSSIHMIKSVGKESYSGRCRENALLQFNNQECYQTYLDLYNDLLVD